MTQPGLASVLIPPSLYALQSKVLERAKETLGRLEQEGRKYDANVFYSAGYDAPFRLINRHNEVRHCTLMMTGAWCCEQ